jgi:hypothetical protein
MEDILAIIFLFGGGTMAALAFSPVGKAIAERIRGGRADGVDPEVLSELDQLRHDVVELQERVDFAERLLAQQRDTAQLGGDQKGALP